MASAGASRPGNGETFPPPGRRLIRPARRSPARGAEAFQTSVEPSHQTERYPRTIAPTFGAASPL